MATFSSKKQNTLTRSNTEVEDKTIATATEELEGLISVLTELGTEISMPLKIYNDNKGTSFIANNPIGNMKIKHMEMDLGFIRERTENDTLTMDHISGTLQTCMSEKLHKFEEDC